LTAPQTGRIFISYRRADSAGYAGRIFDRLAAHFGEDAIFMDVATIEAGLDFVEVLENAVQACDVLVALMGKQWVNIKDETGERRLDNPQDFVRVEVSTALSRGVRVIPVLVDGTSMPTSGQLPNNLKPLARRNAVLVNHYSFHDDANRLIEQLERALKAAEESKILKAKKLKEEDVRKKRQEEIENLLSQADIAFDLQDWELAKEKLEAALTLEPSHAQAQIKLAIIERKQREIKEKADQEEARRIAREKTEREAVEKVAKEKAEAEKIAAQKSENERIAKAKLEAERLANEKAVAERKAKEEKERIAKQKADEERNAKAKLEEERLAKEKAEAELKTREDIELKVKQETKEKKEAQEKVARIVPPMLKWSSVVWISLGWGISWVVFATLNTGMGVSHLITYPLGLGINGFIVAQTLKSANVIYQQKSRYWMALGFALNEIIFILLPFYGISSSIIYGIAQGFIVSTVLKREMAISKLASMSWISVGWSIGYAIAYMLRIFSYNIISYNIFSSILFEAFVTAIIGAICWIVLIWQLKRK